MSARIQYSSWPSGTTPTAADRTIWTLEDLDRRPGTAFVITTLTPNVVFTPAFERPEPWIAVVVEGTLAGERECPRSTILRIGADARLSGLFGGPGGATVLELYGGDRGRRVGEVPPTTGAPTATTWNKLEWTELPLGLLDFVVEVGRPSESSSATLVVQYMPPGAVLPRHSHATEFADAVVAGSMSLDGVEHPTGTARMLDRGAVYGPMIGCPGGCITVELYADERGRPADIDPDDMTDEVRAAFGAPAADC